MSTTSVLPPILRALRKDNPDVWVTSDGGAVVKGETVRVEVNTAAIDADLLYTTPTNACDALAVIVAAGADAARARYGVPDEPDIQPTPITKAQINITDNAERLVSLISPDFIGDSDARPNLTHAEIDVGEGGADIVSTQGHALSAHHVPWLVSPEPFFVHISRNMATALEGIQKKCTAIEVELGQDMFRATFLSREGDILVVTAEPHSTERLPRSWRELFPSEDAPSVDVAAHVPLMRALLARKGAKQGDIIMLTVSDSGDHPVALLSRSDDTVVALAAYADEVTPTGHEDAFSAAYLRSYLESATQALDLYSDVSLVTSERNMLVAEARTGDDICGILVMPRRTSVGEIVPGLCEYIRVTP
jgi:hypothetical protein